MKMIEVPEEHLQALREWRRTHGFGAISMLIDALVACLPKPIEVGSRVRMPGGSKGTVIAIADDDAWLQYDNGSRQTWPIAKLEVIE